MGGRFIERLTYRAGPTVARRRDFGPLVFGSARACHAFWWRQRRSTLRRRRQAKHRMVAGTGTVPVPWRGA